MDEGGDHRCRNPVTLNKVSLYSQCSKYYDTCSVFLRRFSGKDSLAVKE